MADDGASALERVEKERDLYLGLLSLTEETDVGQFLEEALGLVVDGVGARHGYLELIGRSDDEQPWTARGFSSDAVQKIQRAISRGILAEALATGETVVTHAATLDPRFRDRESIVSSEIASVICSPIGEPPLGALYLEGEPDGGAFSDADARRVEVLARHLGPLVARLFENRERLLASDATLQIRTTLDADAVIGRSAALAHVLEQAALVAPLDVTVLISGASGTGKNLLARMIHDNGPRSAGPFVEVNCAALPEGLFENELFGAEEGGHSTAMRPILGKVASAEGGTLFLDEIGEMPIQCQAKVLQLLQSKQYFPLGGTTAQQADIRVIAASNTDLEGAVVEKRFREDLLYRLQILPLRMPSLAERVEDLELLAAHLAATASTRHGLPSLLLSLSAASALRTAEWPGNVRQLANAIEAAVIRAAGSGATAIERQHLFLEAPDEEDASPTFQEATRLFQRDLLAKTLAETRWNISEAARRMDVSRSYIYSLISAFGLQRADDPNVQ